MLFEQLYLLEPSMWQYLFLINYKAFQAPQICSSPVTNPGHELLFINHQRSLTHHMDFHTTQSATDHSRTAFPIIHCTNTAVHNDHACTCLPSHNHHHPITHTHTHTLLKLWSFPYSLPSIVSPATYQAFPSIPS